MNLKALKFSKRGDMGEREWFAGRVKGMICKQQVPNIHFLSISYTLRAGSRFDRPRQNREGEGDSAKQPRHCCHSSKEIDESVQL